MLNVLRFRNAVDQLNQARKAGYSDATMRNLQVRLQNPISAEERNHLLHVHGVHAHGPVRRRRITNAGTETVHSIALELCAEWFDRKFGEKLEQLQAFCDQRVPLIANMDDETKRKILSAIPQKLLDFRQSLITELADKFNAQAQEILQRRQDSGKALIEPPRTLDERLKANLEAFKLLDKVVKNKVLLTAEERVRVSRYTGWGGLRKFLKRDYQDPTVALLKEPIENKYKGQIPKDGPLCVRWEQTQYEYYTPVTLVDAIYATAAPLLKSAENQLGQLIALEPSAGIGRFVEPMTENIKWTLVELQPQQNVVLQALFPQARLHPSSFEHWANKNAAALGGSFNMIVANPPYGRREVGSKDTDPVLRGVSKLEQYFLLRCLPLLAKLGVAIFVIPHGFLDDTSEKACKHRREMLDQWHLAAAARLPSDVFDVLSPIDVLFCVGRGGKINMPAEDQYIADGKYFEQHPEHILGTPEIVMDRLHIKSNKSIKVSDMPTIIGKNLRPIEAMYSYNQPIADEEKPEKPSTGGSDTKSPTPTPRPSGKKPSTATTREAGTPDSIYGDSFQSAQKRLVLSAGTRHAIKACMLAEHITTVMELGASGNHESWEAGKSGHNELSYDFDALVTFLSKNPTHLKEIKGWQEQGVEGAKLFFDYVWQQPDKRLKAYPEKPATTTRSAYLAVECTKLFPQGTDLGTLFNSLGMDIENGEEKVRATLHTVIDELCSAGWYILPNFDTTLYDIELAASAPYSLTFGDFNIYPLRAATSGDLGLKFRQASTALQVIEKIAKAATLLSQFDATLDLWGDRRISLDEKINETDEEALYYRLATQIDREAVLEGAKLHRLWRLYLAADGDLNSSCNKHFRASYNLMCNTIGFADVEPLIPYIELDGAYVAPQTLGEVIYSVLKSRLQREVPEYANGFCYSCLIWQGKSFAVTPDIAGGSPLDAYNWLQKYGTYTAKMELNEQFFLSTKPKRGFVYLKRATVGDNGETPDFNLRLGRVNYGELEECQQQVKWKQNPITLVYWPDGSLPKEAPDEISDQIVHNCLFVLAKNNRKKILGTEAQIAGESAESMDFRQRRDAVNVAIATLTLHDDVRNWLLNDFVTLQIRMKEALKVYEEEMKGAKNKKQQDEAWQKLATAYRRGGVPYFHILTKQYQEYGRHATLELIEDDLSTYADLPVVPFQCQIPVSKEAFEDLVALDGHWICVNEVGIPLLGAPGKEFAKFIDAALQGCQFAAIRFAPDKAEAADYALQMRNELLDVYAEVNNQQLLQYRLRAYCAPYTRRTTPEELPWLMRWKRKYDAAGKDIGGVDPMPHQVQGAWQTFYDKGAVLAYDVGVGKTYTGTLTTIQHRQYSDAKRILFILPNPLTVKWCRDFNRCAPDYAVSILTSNLIAVEDMAGQTQLQTTPSSIAERNQKIQDWQLGLYDVLIMPRQFLVVMKPTILSHYACYRRLVSEQDNVVQKLAGPPWSPPSPVGGLSTGANAASFLYGTTSKELAQQLANALLTKRPESRSPGEEGPEYSFDPDAAQQYEDEVIGIWQAWLLKGGSKVRGGRKAGVIGEDITEITPADGDEEIDATEEDDDTAQVAVVEQNVFNKSDVTFEQFECDLVVIDESQMFKNLWFPTKFASSAPKFLGSPQTSAQAIALDTMLAVSRLSRPTKVQLLSATPAKNSPLELYTALKYIDTDWLNSRGVNTVAAFADRFLRLGRTLYIKNTGELERDALAITSFADVEALRALLFRYATFLTSEAALAMLPENKRTGVKPKAIPMNIEITLTQSDQREVACLRGLIDEMGDLRQKATDVVNLHSVAAKEKSSIMLALSVLPKIGAQSEFSYVARPYAVTTSIYNPFTFTDYIISRERLWRQKDADGSDSTGVVPVRSLYSTDYVEYPTAKENRTMRRETVAYYFEDKTQQLLAEHQQEKIDELKKEIAEVNENEGDSDVLTRSIVSVADSIYTSLMALFAKSCAANPKLVQRKGADHYILPPKWWWDATVAPERAYMLRQLARKQMKMAPWGQFGGYSFGAMTRLMIDDQEPMPETLLHNEKFSCFPLQQVGEGNNAQWKVSDELAALFAGKTVETFYEPGEKIPVCVDKYYGYTTIGTPKQAKAAAEFVDKLAGTDGKWLQCGFVLYDLPDDSAKISRTYAGEDVRPWVSHSSSKVVAGQFKDTIREMSDVAKANMVSANQYYPLLPDKNLEAVKSAFLRTFSAARFSAQAATPPLENLWQAFNDIKPSARVEALVKSVQQPLFEGKAQIIFCLEKDLQLAIYWGLVQAGRDPMRIGVMNAETTKTAADKLRFANMLNGVEGEPDTATLDIIIANSVAYEGIDLQVRTIAIHHFDLPWEPATLTQRNGRAWRQGNTNPEVHIIYYTARDSADSYRMQMLLGKSGWIQQLVESKDFALTNPSADPTVAREAQITALCPDAEAAQLVSAKLKEVEQREQAVIKKGFIARLMLKLARLNVEIANLDYSKSESAVSLYKQRQIGRQELLGAKEAGLVDDAELLSVVLRDEPVAVMMIRAAGKAGTKAAMPVRVGDMIAVQDGRSAFSVLIALRLLAFGFSKIDGVLWVDEQGNLKTYTDASRPWLNLTSLMRQITGQVEATEANEPISTYERSRRLVQASEDIARTNELPQYDADVLKLLVHEVKGEITANAQTCPFPRYSGWMHLAQTLTISNLAAVFAQQDVYEIRNLFAKANRQLNIVKSLGSDFPVVRPYWQALQKELFTHVVQQATKSRPDGFYELLTLSLSGVSAATLSTYLSRAVSDLNSTQTELLSADERKPADAVEKYLAGLPDDVRNLLTTKVRSACSMLLSLPIDRLRLVAGKRAYWGEPTTYSYSYFFNYNDKTPEMITLLEEVDNELESRSEMNAPDYINPTLAQKLIRGIVDMLRVCIKDQRFDRVTKAVKRSSGLQELQMRHELPVLYKASASAEPVIGIWYPYFRRLTRDYTTNDRCFNIVQIAAVDANATLTTLANGFVVVPIEQLQTDTIEQHFQIIPPDASGWALFRAAKNLNPAVLGKFCASYFEITGEDFTYLRRSLSFAANAFSP